MTNLKVEINKQYNNMRDFNPSIERLLYIYRN